MCKSSPTRPSLSSQKGSPNSQQWLKRRQHPINLDRPWDAHKTCRKLAEADSGRLWRFSYVHSELCFWLLRKALIELQERQANPYTRATLRRGLFWRLYSYVWSSFNQHAGILSSLGYIFLLVACNVTVLFSTKLERVRGRQTMRFHSILYCISEYFCSKQDADPHHLDQRRIKVLFDLHSTSS